MPCSVLCLTFVHLLTEGQLWVTVAVEWWDTDDEKNAAFVALFLLCRSHDWRTKAVTSPFVRYWHQWCEEKYSFSFWHQIHYVLLGVSAYRKCLFIVQYKKFHRLPVTCVRWEWSSFETHMTQSDAWQWHHILFFLKAIDQMRMEQFWNPRDTVRRLTVTSRSVLSQSVWSDENGEILKPPWHNQTLDSDIIVCSFSEQLIIHCVVTWLLNCLWPFVGMMPATRNTRTVTGLCCRKLVSGVDGVTIQPPCPCLHFFFLSIRHCIFLYLFFFLSFCFCCFPSLLPFSGIHIPSSEVLSQGIRPVNGVDSSPQGHRSLTAQVIELGWPWESGGGGGGVCAVAVVNAQ